jgi:hypothetical protein
MMVPWANVIGSRRSGSRILPQRYANIRRVSPIEQKFAVRLLYRRLLTP